MLDELPLNTTIAQCDHCALGSRKGLGIGNPLARVLLLAQNPGKYVAWNPRQIPFELHLWEDGQPKHSAAVLQAMIDEQEIPYDDLYVTNTMKCQGPTHQLYIANCTDWLEGELLNLPRVQLIVALGSVASQRLECSEIGRLTWYASKLDPPTRWWATPVAHPAAPLYPGGISMQQYRAQWGFVGSVYRRL